jgi:type II secretory pathway component GspD/PulD (secretin)
LFSSTRDELKEVETVILLTPRLVRAGKGDNIPAPQIK